jgi:ubiquinone/menaquinone biosynthesis C-methylase UbiE
MSRACYGRDWSGTTTSPYNSDSVAARYSFAAWDRLMIRNEDVYRLAGVAEGYARQSDLQPPEEAILRLMLPTLPRAKMLDLGVGGGRTTLHFAKWVREYVGADYSESMITECRRRFSTYPDHISFAVCDARSMEMFASASFDFILFSFNGIDYVSHVDRLKILKEIRRVGKPGGWFCFSSHNLNSCAQLFKLSRMVSLNPRFAVRTAKRLVLRFLNWRVRTSTVMRAPYMAITDASHDRQLRTYYVRPEEQFAQLSEDFTDVQVFSLATGAEVRGHTELRNVEDSWLYYLCRIR